MDCQEQPRRERRLVSTGGVLDSPWGLAIAPASFGPFGGALLVGNFGDGRINAFDPLTGVLVGTLHDSGQVSPLAIEGLHGLRFGNGGNGGAAGTLYFAAGPMVQGVQHGLLGSLEPTFGPTPTPVPEPSTGLLLATGMAALFRIIRRRSAC